MSAWARLRALAFGIGSAALFVFGCAEQKYPWGRDTKDSFGDGRFQIVRASHPRRLVLFDCERNDPVVRHVKNWKAKSGYLFLIDDADKCWKVNYQTGAVASYEKVDAAEADDRRVFEGLLER